MICDDGLSLYIVGRCLEASLSPVPSVELPFLTLWVSGVRQRVCRRKRRKEEEKEAEILLSHRGCHHVRSPDDGFLFLFLLSAGFVTVVVVTIAILFLTPTLKIMPRFTLGCIVSPAILLYNARVGEGGVSCLLFYVCMRCVLACVKVISSVIKLVNFHEVKETYHVGGLLGPHCHPMKQCRQKASSFSYQRLFLCSFWPACPVWLFVPFVCLFVC